MVRKLILLAIVVVGLLALLQYSQHQPQRISVSGFIEADEIRLGSRVGGRVSRVLVEEGVRVEPGQVLVELEPFDLLDRRAQAEAELSRQLSQHDLLTAGYREEEKAQAEARLQQSQAELDRLEQGPRPQEIDAARADVELALAERTLAEETLARQTKLGREGAGTQDALDRAQKELKTSQARVVARQKQLDLLEEGTRVEDLRAARAKVAEATAARDLTVNGYRPEEVAQAYAAQRVAESARNIIDSQLQELKITAPVATVVDAVDLQPGDLVSPNAPVLSLIDADSLWVRAYVPEDRLNLQIGEQLPVTVDSYPGQVFQGELRFVSRQAEFTPSNVQTPEERSQQVFRIKVVLQDAEHLLRPGMAADIWLQGSP
ncbi:MAG: HlyD family secretion protein [Planctomycetaceae bacterium]